MNGSHNQSLSRRKRSTAKRLADDLAELDSKASSISRGDNEMLSLMVDEALKGVDIMFRYPTFYRKLLNSIELRQAFIDALELIEIEKKGGLVALPEAAEPRIAFLSNLPVRPIVKKIKKEQWQINWQRTIEQLQAIFFPTGLGLAYRSDPSLFEDAWFTLLRGDIDVKGSSYSVLLECGISENIEDSLSAFLNVAVTLESTAASSQFPISATLHWGKYSEMIKITGQGRVRFPDIPFTMAFDEKLQNITSELNMTIETGPRLQKNEPR